MRRSSSSGASNCTKGLWSGHHGRTRTTAELEAGGGFLGSGTQDGNLLEVDVGTIIKTSRNEKGTITARGELQERMQGQGILAED
jgi:hypothetical protein